jgi:hypothetical protein
MSTYLDILLNKFQAHQHEIVVVLLNKLEGYQHEIVIVSFCVFVLIWKRVKIRPPYMSVAIGTAALLAVLAVSAYLLTISFYLLYPNYFDHGQPIVASISSLWMEGHELYPSWTTSNVYGLVYGPMIFLINALALQLSPSILSSKVPGVLALGAALAALFMVLKLRVLSILTSLFLLASLIILLGLFDAYSYWNRPEPFLILASVLALTISLMAPPLVAAVSIGILAGAGVGLKLHGFVYMVPAAAVALARLETRRDRFVNVLVGSACAVGCVLLLYLLKGASIPGYLRFLRVAVDDGWSACLFRQNLLLAFGLTAPIVGIWIWQKPALNRQGRWLLAALGISVAVITVIGSKAMGGPYYFLPLIPQCIYGIAVVCASCKTEAKQITAAIFVSLLVAYGPHLFLHTRELKNLYQIATPSEQQKITELKTYLQTYPDAQIGISDDQYYPSYYYRVFSVWQKRPVRVDFGVWMDLAYAGVDEKYIARFIEGCAVPTWILPLGTPFAKNNFYDDLPLLSEKFRQTFSNNYRQVVAGQAYQVWECKS